MLRGLFVEISRVHLMDYSGIVKCVNFAAMKHRNQRRKDDEQTPYINHPVGKY